MCEYAVLIRFALTLLVWCLHLYVVFFFPPRKVLILYAFVVYSHSFGCGRDSRHVTRCVAPVTLLYHEEPKGSQRMHCEHSFRLTNSVI